MNFAKRPSQAFRNALRRLASRKNDVDRYVEAVDRAAGVARAGVPRSRIGHEILLVVKRHFGDPLEAQQAHALAVLEGVLGALGARGLPLIHKQDKTLRLTDQLEDVVLWLGRRSVRIDASGYVEPARARFDALQGQLRSRAVKRLSDREAEALRIWRDELDFTLFHMSGWLRFDHGPPTYNANHVWPATRHQLRRLAADYASKHSLAVCRRGLDDELLERRRWIVRSNLMTIFAGRPQDAALALEAARDFRAAGDNNACAAMLRQAAKAGAESAMDRDPRSRPEGLAFLEELLLFALETRSRHVPAIVRATLAGTTSEITPVIDELERRLGAKLREPWERRFPPP